MRLKSLKVVLSVAALALTGLVTLASPASAAPGALVCAVAGTVNVSPGVGRIPPGSNNDGGYSFDQVALVCVGANATPDAPMTGLNNATSSGSFGVGPCDGDDVPLIGSFCGGYSAGPGILSPFGGSCSGTVGGDEAAGAVSDPVGAVGRVAAGDWSVTFGPLILGGITCNSGSYAGGAGVLALVGVPLPTAIDSSLGPITSSCADPPPTAEELLVESTVGQDVPSVHFCQIAIAGVAVIADAT